MPTYLMTARLPEGGLRAFEDYETAVLPLVARHGGRVERRLRALDDSSETHVVSFPDDASFAAFRADPDRISALPLVESSGARVELVAVRDIAVD